MREGEGEGRGRGVEPAPDLRAERGPPAAAGTQRKLGYRRATKLPEVEAWPASRVEESGAEPGATPRGTSIL